MIPIRNQHNDIILRMAQGVVEYKESFGGEGRGVDPVASQNAQYFLDHFWSRISVRTLLSTLHCLVGETKEDHFMGNTWEA